ncbi:uncharacterized protein LOC111297003 [Durio zibethinus]|uniref:Uncharacterized protein LOC111297003 n=1 Tax=Durio zibethinus TaxID=66656 RepID=A0A6P5Z3S1_DURZI|nr:uncharacterized protein LOC111297003 [Durio zibethinus]
MPSLQTLRDLDDHPHPLKLKKSKAPFICDGCKVEGFGFCYQCTEGCDFFFHKECGIRRPPACQKFFEGCEFKFHKKNPLGGDRICDVCALDIQGFLYQSTCRKNPNVLHPCCANLPMIISPPYTDMKIYLCNKIKTECLKCGSKKRSADKVQGFSYASSDGEFCYHVACLREVGVENWIKSYCQPDVIADNENKPLSLIDLALKKVAPVGMGAKARKQ